MSLENPLNKQDKFLKIGSLPFATAMHYAFNALKHNLPFTPLLLFFAFLIGITSTSAQNQLAIGQWREHLPYRQFISLTQSDETLYCATEWSVLQIDKEEMSLTYLSKIDGLSNAGMGLIKYSKQHEVLIATYSNSIFDLVYDDRIVTFEDIKTDGNFTNRTIKHIHLDGDFAYFSTSFGIVRFNLVEEEFDFTLNLGIEVSAVATFQNQIYAATEEGIYNAPDNANELNLQDFSNWTLLDYTDGFPEAYSSTAIVVFQEQLYFDIDGALNRMITSGIEEIYPAQDDLYINYLTHEAYGLLVGLRCGDSCAGKTLYITAEGEIREMGFQCSSRPLIAIEDQEGKIWLGDTWRGLRRAFSGGGSCELLEFNSPLTHNSSQLLINDNNIYIASGGVKANGSFAGRSDGTFILNENGNWEIVNRWTVPLIENEDAILDHYKIALHPDSKKLYIGTFWGGLIEKDGDNYKIYNETNSSLRGADGDEARERVAGLAFDNANNLWIANHAAPQPLSVFKADGTWQSFDVPSNNGLRHLVIDQVGYKWAAVDGTGQGVLIFDDGGTIDVVGDDRFRIITSSNSELPDNNVFSLAVDQEGSVWIGTANGVAVVNCGSVAIESDCPVSKIIFEENIIDDENEYLLKGEQVNAIAIDGANRKWFGTTNGLFLISADGKEQIAFFNEDNSPLIDNNIIDIAINSSDGEVFIATNKGVVSYRGDATRGGIINSSSAYAFPNPVRPEYRGPIAIKGLAENADVKITDVSGQLIYETQALGGQAIWDGTDYNGRRASSGVYLVFSTSNSLEAPNTVVTKILFIN